MRINIEIGDIEAFIELTETNSFAKAATNLNLSQPALSRRIQKLENELGTTLFDRTTRKVQLSYSGRNFYDRARGIIEAVKTATKTLSEKYSFPSIIKIGVVHSALRNILFSALKDLKEIEPRCKVQIIERSSNNVVDWKGSGSRIYIENALAMQKEDMEWAYEVRHIPTALNMVEQGLGITLAPKLAISKDYSSLSYRPLIDPAVTRTIGLIKRSGRELSYDAQKLYELLIEKFKR